MLNMSSLQDRIRIALEQANHMKPGTLARLIGIHRATVSLWLKGPTQTIDGDNLIKAARILKVNPQWLATGEGHMHPGVREPTIPYTPVEDLLAKISQLPDDERARLVCIVDALLEYHRRRKP